MLKSENSNELHLWIYSPIKITNNLFIFKKLYLLYYLKVYIIYCDALK